MLYKRYRLDVVVGSSCDKYAMVKCVLWVSVEYDNTSFPDALRKLIPSLSRAIDHWNFQEGIRLTRLLG